MEDTTTTTPEVAYTAPDGKEYTPEALAALTRDERQALAVAVVTDSIESLDDSELVYFIADYERENYSEFGDGFDVSNVGEFCDCMTGSKPDKWCSLIEDIVAAAVNGRVTGSDYLHYDSYGNLYIEDWDDVTRRAREVVEDFSSEVCDWIDPDDFTLDLRYVDVPDDVDGALEELATAYEDSRDGEEGE